MTDDIPVQNTSKVVAVAQDYIIIGKSTKETELRINFYSDDFEDGKRRIENGLRLKAYMENINSGAILLPKYEKVEKPHIRVENATEDTSQNKG